MSSDEFDVNDFGTYSSLGRFLVGPSFEVFVSAVASGNEGLSATGGSKI